jgi:hypothetical protein
MEKVAASHPVRKLGEGGKWLQSARSRMKKKGTVGLFGRKAAAAGKSTQEYAREEYHAPGVLGEEARFAANAGKRK